MVASSSADVSDPNSTVNTRAVIVCSAKMHLGVSLAVIHLHDAGGIPKEISDIITELHKTLGKHSTSSLPNQPKPASFSYEIQSPPLKILMNKNHTPRDHREVMARRGDHVIVYAWTGFEAIAYNTRNKTTGRVPRTLLNKHAQEECNEDKLYLATSDGRTTIECPVLWKRGDYIRVWDLEDDSNSRASGLCFNLASGQIGRFYTNASFSLKLVD